MCDRASPLAVFIHGGWWQRCDPAMFSVFAKGLHCNGINVAMPGYDQCPHVGINVIIEQLQRAILALWKQYGRRMLVLGHSAGGHLTASMLATNWSLLDASAPCDLVSAGYAISGLFDLRPMVQMSMNVNLQLSEQQALQVSPLHSDMTVMAAAATGSRLVLDAVVGGAESPGFFDQSQAITDVWGQQGVTTRYEAVPDKDHFTVLDDLKNPRSGMVQRLLHLTPRPPHINAN